MFLEPCGRKKQVKIWCPQTQAPSNPEAHPSSSSPQPPWGLETALLTLSYPGFSRFSFPRNNPIIFFTVSAHYFPLRKRQNKPHPGDQEGVLFIPGKLTPHRKVHGGGGCDAYMAHVEPLGSTTAQGCASHPFIPLVSVYECQQHAGQWADVRNIWSKKMLTFPWVTGLGLGCPPD